MINLDDIKAGEYEVVALHWDEVTSKSGQPFDFVRHRRGDTVKLNVEDARRLVVGGAVVKPGEVSTEAELGRQDSTPPGEDSTVEDVAPVTPGSPPVTPTPPKPGDVDLADIASSTAPVVLAWVGDDKEKATKALEAEQGRGDDARKGLTADLTSIAEKQA